MQTIYSQQNTLQLSGDNLQLSALKDESLKLPSKSNNIILKQSQSLPFVYGLAALISALIFGAWWGNVFVQLQSIIFGTHWTAAVNQNLVVPPIPLAAVILLAVGIGVAYVVEYVVSEKKFLYLICFFAIWFFGGALVAHLANVDVLAVPAFFAGILTFFAVQIRPHQHVEKKLSEDIRRLAMSAHLLEGKHAEGRMKSGLAILQTVLPLDEIIVFQLGKHGELVATGRTREDLADELRSKPKHAEWREGISLCDKVLQTGKPAIQKISGTPGAARVAVALVHEGDCLGVLLVRFRENFESADENVLTAFASQLARNFQREGARLQDHQQSFLDVFSPAVAQHRLDLFRLVSGVLIEQQFGSLAFADLADGYAIAYLDGTLAHVNKAMLRAAQMTGDRAKQGDLFDLLGRFKGGVFDDPRIAVRRVMQTGEPYRHEIFFAERGGNTLDLQIALVRQPIEDDSPDGKMGKQAGAPLCFMISVRDVTSQKENEKLRSDMVNLMSHELRTPITSINGFAELLMLEDDLSQESREYLRTISTESQRLSKTLNSFLAVSNLQQSDKRDVIKAPVRLDSVAHEVLLNFQSEARKKRIRLVEQANALLPPVAGDKDLLTKVISNLVDNAIKYSPDRTTVMISFALELDALRFVIEDRGYGIPSYSIGRIWEKFYRVPRDGQDKDETSTGLGLSFVKEVVEQHGGAVFVESEINQGSKFSFTLPRL